MSYELEIKYDRVSPRRKGWKMGEERKRKRLTAKRKFEIYLETKQAGAKVGEILRREGIHLNDLREIEELVERGAIGALKSKGPGRLLRKKIDPIEHEQVKKELHDKERAMSDLMVEYALLKKSDRLGLKGISKEYNSEMGGNDAYYLQQSRKLRRKV